MFIAIVFISIDLITWNILKLIREKLKTNYTERLGKIEEILTKAHSILLPIMVCSGAYILFSINPIIWILWVWFFIYYIHYTATKYATEIAKTMVDSGLAKYKEK